MHSTLPTPLHLQFPRFFRQHRHQIPRSLSFEKTGRPILWEEFTRLDDRLTRYYPLVLKLFPDPAKRPRQREVFIEFYRKGKVDEALRAFKKIYLEVVYQIIDHLETMESANSAH